MKKVFLVDNYDSFTYNLYHYFIGLGADVKVLRNRDKGWEKLDFSHLVLSPGPGLPAESGWLMDCLEHYAHKRPILGVCLGMQALAVLKNERLYNLEVVRHGMQGTLNRKSENSLLFKSLPQQFSIGLYHSWAVGLHEDSAFHKVAEDAEGVLMGIENQDEQLFGVQFHPESIMTQYGYELLQNFLSI